MRFVSCIWDLVRLLRPDNHIQTTLTERLVEGFLEMPSGEPVLQLLDDRIDEFREVRL
ncbi:hypothetical protein ACFQJD_02335 [Haloplanus sp. GCM10025708]|uniref:hypothetical protein n=1 Tax=Haloplanus sp. GCM10025708 TaxID=3252679 RepID=UPI003613F076